MLVRMIVCTQLSTASISGIESNLLPKRIKFISDAVSFALPDAPALPYNQLTKSVRVFAIRVSAKKVFSTHLSVDLIRQVDCIPAQCMPMRRERIRERSMHAFHTLTSAQYNIALC